MNDDQPIKSTNKDNWWIKDRAQAKQRPAGERIHDFGEIYATLDPETARTEASRCVQCADPTCVYHCPLGNRIRDWLGLAADGKFLEAAQISQAISSMPEICSRVCPQERLCEKGCALGTKSDPVAIGMVERFINEYAFTHGGVATEPPAVRFDQSVAVIGSGPAGLTLADQLNKKGYNVTIFEIAPDPGGLLMFGIPGFKLDKFIVRRRVKVLEDRGVNFHCGIEVGAEMTLAQLFEKGFQAIAIGTGAQVAKQLKIDGSNLPGVVQALPFLLETNLEPSMRFRPLKTPLLELKDKRVVVLGGGDTAMDCLRSAIRCGARSATCVYRRDEVNMPGSKKEYVNAQAEGAKFIWLTNPVRLIGDASKRVRQIECQAMELGPPDPSGRRSPVPSKAPNYLIDADVVVSAFGFEPARIETGMKTNLRMTKFGTFEVDALGMTNIPGVFAIGDCVSGPDLVVTAVRAGRYTADSIDTYLARKRDQVRSKPPEEPLVA